MIKDAFVSASKSMVLGRHIVAEAKISDYDLLNDENRLLEAITIASKKAGMTVINGSSHKFSPQGATAIVLLAESHVSIHTWPEHGYAAIDVYTCGKDPEPVMEELKSLLPIKDIKVIVIDRGPE